MNKFRDKRVVYKVIQDPISSVYLLFGSPSPTLWLRVLCRLTVVGLDVSPMRILVIDGLKVGCCVAR
jgi:hypothetical protein